MSVEDTLWDSGADADAVRSDYYSSARVCLAFLIKDGFRYPKVWAEWLLRCDSDRIGAS